MEPDVIRDADSPFGPSARADIILRSSDKVDFYALKAFLSYSSSFFDDMFSLPSPESSSDDQLSKGGLPVIEMQEKSRPIRFLLCLCYPNSHLYLDDILEIDDIVQTMFAAEKYAADATGTYLCKKLTQCPEMIQNPLRVFAIAFRFGWDDICRQAAKNTLSKAPDFWPFSNELVYVTGVEMYRLSQYRKKCAERLITSDKLRQLLFDDGRKNYIWWGRENHHWECGQTVSINAFVDANTHLVVQRFNAGWWEQYRDGLLHRLKACPRGTTALDDKLLNNAIQKSKSCPACNTLQCQSDLYNLR
ncbi:unnamed protein product [Cyclocybe aegerita]|uniref:BTB domain-containing protein n=1 Tax=Cyclocybe aegerita TaxID=1973307 RepID=A0A8S0X6Y2_CYCAE|nr:unnamed protein product [Cyclocybe aegerita]